MILAIGENPVEAVNLMVTGALGSTYGWGYTLYYATNFMFTGLAVAVAFHARLFNIGGEGQAMLGGLGVAMVCLYIPGRIGASPCSAPGLLRPCFGAAWAAIPAYLQAKRGSHIVITTIMFNFIAAAFLNYMLVNVMRPQGSQDPATARFPEAVHLPTFQSMFSTAENVYFRGAPANISFFVAILACFVVWALIWRTRLGYEIRAYGHSETGAVYAGISPVRITIVAMLISGALAGLMAINNVMGEAERLVLNSTEGRGLHRYRRGADGPVASVWRVPGGAAVRVPVSGRRRTGAVDLDPARADRRHSGAGDPVYRSVGQHGADAA